MSRTEVDIVLFDLGGVLIDFGGVEPMKALAGIDHDDELWRRWLTCPWVRHFERGGCAADEFAAGIVDDWNLPVEPAAFLAEFATWPGGVLAGADELLCDTQRVMPAGCLSNTNALHWEHNFGHWPILEAFDYCFLSFELGAVKPDRELFDAVAARVPTPPGRVLFLDDNRLNVEGAAAAGFLTEHVRGVDEARRALVRRGVIDG